jgi:hypothetical protein
MRLAVLGLAAALLLCCPATPASALDTLDLNAAAWTVRNLNGSVDLGTVQLPSYPVEELRKQGLIQDTQYRCAEQQRSCRGGCWASAAVLLVPCRCRSRAEPGEASPKLP